MDAIYQHANESKLNFNVPKGQPLHKVWDSLWQQCEAANERLEGHKTCFPKSNGKSISNIMKMLTVFQNEVKAQKEDSRPSVNQTSSEDVCEGCGLSKSKLKLLEDNYDRRGKMIEYLLSMASYPSKMVTGKQPFNEPYVYNEELDNKETLGSKGNSQVLKSTTFVQPRLYPQERETHSRENPTSTLVHLLPNFSKYDPNKDPFSNMSLFEDTCSQHNLGPWESCLMMKLWLPSTMSVRLVSPVSRPAGGLGFWSRDDHWGDGQDRLKALAFLVTGEDDFGIDILEELKVTPQDDPWEFSRKFEQAYRLVMGVKDLSLPPAMLKALVNKFTFLDCATRIAASKERTVDGIVKIVDKYRRSTCVKPTTMMMDQFSPTLHEASMANDEKPVRLQSQPPQAAEGNAWSDQQSPNIQCYSHERPKSN
ncbi:posterior protein-like [Phyllobates terribilis]|uniref:posterior protein-like n=1 Tax=Phyllobates terribilis TaxID=111132 RepID=UPI003CCA8AE7